MNTVFRTASLALSLVTCGTFAWAQHGTGAGHSGGSFGGGHSAVGSFSGAHGGAGIGVPPTGIGPSASVPFRPAQSFGAAASFYGNHSSDYPALSSSHGHSNAYGRSGYGRYSHSVPYRYAYPYAFVGSYYPFFDGGLDSSYNDYGAYGYDSYPSNDYGPNGAAQDPEMGDQIQQLSAQVNDLRNSLQSYPSGFAAGPPVPYAMPPQSSSAQPEPSSPPVTVVLTSGQTLQVQNYAVVGDTFWDFSSQPVRKIPVSAIDVAASTKASETNGAEFPSVAPTH